MPDSERPQKSDPPPPTGGPSPAPESFHILVVDDEEDIRNVVGEMIKIAGYRTSVAESGSKALEILRSTPVHLVFTDLMMPEMNGWQLLRTVKREYPHVHIVLITGYISEHGESILTSQHVDGYLTKPIEVNRLQTLLRALLYPQNLGRPSEVVVIDDDEDVCMAVEGALTRRGIYVTGFRDPDGALRHIRENPPDLAIVDLMLPSTNGFEVCQAIRSDPDTASLPILILTAQPSRENVMRAIQLRVSGFLTKPFDAGQLAERVLKVLRQPSQGGTE